MTMPAAARFWAKTRPGGIALDADGRTWTWLEFNDEANAVAAGLTRLGLKPGDRVGIFMDNCSEWCLAALAVGKLHCVVVPLNVRMAAGEVAYGVSHVTCSVVVTDDAHLQTLTTGLSDQPDVTVVLVGDTESPDRDVVRWPEVVVAGAPDPGLLPTDDELAYLCYTSGTTGRPKAAMITHGNLTAMAFKQSSAESMTHVDRSYLTTSLSFTGSCLTVWGPISHAGGTLVMARKFDPQSTLEALTSGATIFYGPVPLWSPMAALPDVDKRDWSKLRVARAGAGPVPVAQLLQWQARGVMVGQGYGLTESSGTGVLLPLSDAIRKVGYAGLPMMHSEYRVVDGDGNDCPPGEPGEIHMRGPEIMAGYWNNPEATAKAIVDGWLHTGDLGVLDDEGYLKILDRQDDMFVSGGLNVYPAEIERVIQGLPEIAAVAIVAQDNERWGKVGVAFVDADPATTTVEDILAICRAELADYKIPHTVVIEQDTLPRTVSGKVIKKTLRVRAAEMLETPAT